MCVCVCGRRGNGLLGILDCFCMISNTVIKSLAEIDTFVVLWTGKCVRSFVRPLFLPLLWVRVPGILYIALPLLSPLFLSWVGTLVPGIMYIATELAIVG